MSTSLVLKIYFFCYLSSNVLGVLVPGVFSNFITRSGYKYIGNPEVIIIKPQIIYNLCFNIQQTIQLGAASSANIICGHHCMLDQVCGGFYIEGDKLLYLCHYSLFHLQEILVISYLTFQKLKKMGRPTTFSKKEESFKYLR